MNGDTPAPAGPEGARPEPAAPPPTAPPRALAGLANVAALAFLAARAVPGGYWIALAGGVPLARAAARHGTRAGYATAAASLIETVAIMGPARLGIPVPHAASAPAVGRLEVRGARLAVMALTAAAIRLAYYLITSAVFIFVLVGAEAYLGSYERLRELIPLLPAGPEAALGMTAAFLAGWSLLAGWIQAWLLRRGLRRWSTPDAALISRAGPTPRTHGPGRADPRAVAGSAAVAIVLLLITTRTAVLVAVGVWLTAAWALTRAGVRPLLGGLALAAPLALSTLGFGLVGGLATELALRRAGRVGLLVLAAVWLRAAAGADGLRRLSFDLVERLRRLPTLALTALVLGASAGAESYGAAARRLGGRLRVARKRPRPLLDALLAWLADEAGRAPSAAAGRAARRWTALETGLVLLAGVLVGAAVTLLAAR